MCRVFFFYTKQAATATIFLADKWVDTSLPMSASLCKQWTTCLRWSSSFSQATSNERKKKPSHNFWLGKKEEIPGRLTRLSQSNVDTTINLTHSRQDKLCSMFCPNIFHPISLRPIISKRTIKAQIFGTKPPKSIFFIRRTQQKTEIWIVFTTSTKSHRKVKASKHFSCLERKTLRPRIFRQTDSWPTNKQRTDSTRTLVLDLSDAYRNSILLGLPPSYTLNCQRRNEIFPLLPSWSITAPKTLILSTEGQFSAFKAQAFFHSLLVGHVTPT